MPILDFEGATGYATAMADGRRDRYDIICDWDVNKVSFLVLLDFSKDFDMLNYALLISILHFRTFLSDRRPQVVLDGQFSHVATLNVGVPQGSILGPLLYIIYTNQL